MDEHLKLRYTMLDLMRGLANGQVGDEAMADRAAGMAAEMDAAGNTAEADSLRRASRRHRVRALESQGRLAALSQDYAGLFRGAASTA